MEASAGQRPLKMRATVPLRLPPPEPQVEPDDDILAMMAEFSDLELTTKDTTPRVECRHLKASECVFVPNKTLTYLCVQGMSAMTLSPGGVLEFVPHVARSERIVVTSGVQTVVASALHYGMFAVLYRASAAASRLTVVHGSASASRTTTVASDFTGVGATSRSAFAWSDTAITDLTAGGEIGLTPGTLVSTCASGCFILDHSGIFKLMAGFGPGMVKLAMPGIKLPAGIASFGMAGKQPVFVSDGLFPGTIGVRHGETLSYTENKNLRIDGTGVWAWGTGSQATADGATVICSLTVESLGVSISCDDPQTHAPGFEPILELEFDDPELRPSACLLGVSSSGKPVIVSNLGVWLT